MEPHRSWDAVLEPHTARIEALLAIAGDVWPRRADVLRALTLPRDEVRVVVVGQDPYPTPGHAHGLAFSVPEGVSPLPRSLVNIFRELAADTGEVRQRGDLSDWHAQGVLLLNRVLTVDAGVAGSHRGRGWEAVTEAILRASDPRVVLLWGRDAQSTRGFFSAPILESAHPSPLSASRGFFGTRPFSRVNAVLRGAAERPIHWVP